MNKKIELFIQTMKEKQLTLALAESMTCGLAAHKLSTIKGISEVLVGSVVCYSPEVKTSLLCVSETQVKKYTCESKEVTKTLVKNLSRLMPADVHAAITGLASPGGSETKDKPVGTVFFSIRYKNKIYNHQKYFKDAPLKVREKACMELYDLILSKI